VAFHLAPRRDEGETYPDRTRYPDLQHLAVVRALVPRILQDVLVVLVADELLLRDHVEHLQDPRRVGLAARARNLLDGRGKVGRGRRAAEAAARVGAAAHADRGALDDEEAVAELHAVQALAGDVGHRRLDVLAEGEAL
jgi:hypothetical protein